MKGSLDGVTVQLLRNRVASLIEELHYHLYRSGYSTIIRESRDFSCAVTDRMGRIAVAPALIVHATIYRSLIEKILELHATDGIRAGDVFVCNHPYEGGVAHVSDMAVIAPIFSDQALIGFVGSIAHKPDVGGSVPGSVSGQATELFQEGLLLPPVKLYQSGSRNEDMARLLRANCRWPSLLMGDLEGQVGVVTMGAERIAKLCQEFGASVFAASMEAVLKASEREFRTALAALPEQTHEAEGFLDSDGVRLNRPVRFHARVTHANGRLRFDLSGCDPQTTGPVNLRPPLIEACCFHALIGLLNPDLRFTDGARAVVELIAPKGSVVNALPPAPVSSYMMACQKLIDVLLEAMNPFKPERAVANAGGSGGAISLAWRDQKHRERGNQYEILGSAYGASAAGDGCSGITVHLSNIHAASIEIIESEYPCRIERFELIADSGGGGKFRGGLGVRRRYRMLAPVTMIYRGDRAKNAPKGIEGGCNGAPSRLLLHPGTDREEQLPSSCRMELEAGSVVDICAAGGGGFGLPGEREPQRMKSDLEEGYVTPEGAAKGNASAA